MNGLFLPIDLPGTRQEPNERTREGEEPVLHPQVPGCLLCFPRTWLVLHIGLLHFMFPSHIHIALSSPQTRRSGMLEGLSPPDRPSCLPLPPCKTLECSFSQLLLLSTTSLPSPVVLFLISIALCHSLFLYFLSTPLASLKVLIFQFSTYQSYSNKTLEDD